MPMFCAANLRLALAGLTMLFSSSAMRFRSARPHQIRSTLILASMFTSLDCQYITFSCYASTRPVFTSPLRILTIQNESIRDFANTSPILFESMPMLSLLSNSMPMRIVSLPCLYRSSPIFAPAYRLPAIQCHRTALPRQHLALPSPALPCQYTAYCSLMTSYWKAPCPAFLH